MAPKVTDLAGIVEYYDKVKEQLKQEIEILKKQIADLDKRKKNLIDEINAEIYKTKAENDKIIADAKEQAAKIISATDEQKQHNEAEAERLAAEWEALKNKEISVLKELTDLDSKKSAFVKEQDNYAKTLGNKMVKIDNILTSLIDLQSSLDEMRGKINNKIDVILKLE